MVDLNLKLGLNFWNLVAVSLAINHVSPQIISCPRMYHDEFLGVTPAHVLVELLQRRKDEKLQN